MQGSQGRAATSTFAQCYNDMNVLLNCWKTSNFDDATCAPAMQKFTSCLAASVRHVDRACVHCVVVCS